MEWDELHSFVGKKGNERWLWVTLCRRTRQVLSFDIGSRDGLRYP
ncbi:IS1 family transposase [Candidatus Uabimicrobium sp. HlEnr_7]